MNKTVTINISGIIFNIDEEAFNKLKQYLDTIKSYFSNSEGKDEIMADIEARIAEVFQEKLSGKNQVISVGDVDEVIKLMGEPEDYLDEEQGEGFKENKTNFSSGPRPKKKLYRDPDSKILGGVCSGIGHYFDVDPIIFRALFVIAFLGFGTGILFYIVLWVIMPEAKTTAEKLEMKGESVTIDNIKKKVEEEARDLKNRFNDLKDKAGPSVRTGTEKTRNFFSSFISFLASLLTMAFKFAGKFLGIIFLIAGSIALVSLLISVFTTSKIVTAVNTDGVNSYGLSELSNIFFSSGFDSFLGILGVFLVAGVPLFFLTVAGLKLLLGDRIKSKLLGVVGFSLWILGLIFTAYAGVSTLSEFGNKGKQEKVINLETSTIKTLKVEVDNSKLPISKYSHKRKKFKKFDDDYFQISDEKVFLSGYTLDIQPSDDSTYKLVVSKFARGNSEKVAAARAKAINFNFSLIDSTLVLEPLFNFSVEDKWRRQDLELTLLVPYGKSVFIDESTKNVIYDIDNVTNTWDTDMLNLKWTMLTNGLTCKNCFEDWQGDNQE